MEKQNVTSLILSIKKLLDIVEHQSLAENVLESFEQSLTNGVALFYNNEENFTADIVAKYVCNKCSISSIPSDSKWSFVTLACYLLLSLKDKLESHENEDVKKTLVSLNEEREVKRSVEICVSLGLVGALLPGIGIPLEKRSKFISLIKSDQNFDIVENYDRLSFIAKILSQLINSNTILKSIVLSCHLGDYLSALFQLSYAPLLKPGRTNKENTFTMTEEFYSRLVNERQRFKSELGQLVCSINQTELLKQVMLLFGYCVQSGGKKHVWFTNVCTSILNQTLGKSNGIEILLKAMCDDDYTSPLVWKKLDIVARILATLKSSYNVTCPQVLEMLQYSDDHIQSSEQLKLYHQFAIATCKHFYEYDADTFHAHIFNQILSPLANMTQESNEKLDLTNCLIVLNRLFSHVEGLPREILVKYVNQLFFVHVQLTASPLFIPAKASLHSLLCTLFTSFSVEQSGVLMNKMIFQVEEVQCSGDSVHEEAEALDEDDIADDVQDSTDADSMKLLDGMLNFPPGSIHISSTGNVSYVPPESGTHAVADDYESYGHCVLALLTKINSKTASYNLLIRLLNNYTKEIFKDDIDRNVVNVKLLNDLVGVVQMEEFISTNPQHIIMFIEFLIKQSIKRDEEAPCTDNSYLLCTGLTLLFIIMSKHNAPLFLHIVPSLEALINQSDNEEVTLLAKQSLEQIKASNVQHPRGTKKGESYEKAMSDACDTLLPVRAHGIATLTKLILSGDANAKANRSALLCLFMENLSDDDSYLYLSAVEGLAALASDHADSVVDTLTQHFMSSTRQLELRLKLGEVLMKVARHLGEMLAKYKSHFLNTFLHGCRDEDHLMRTSSLSNLAEVCKILGFRVGSILTEIFICMKCIISSDPYPEPRRAATMVASFLLCGLKQEALQVLEPILPELYRTLRHVYESDPDDRTRLHASLALEQLNEAVKAFLTPRLPDNFATLRL